MVVNLSENLVNENYIIQFGKYKGKNIIDEFEKKRRIDYLKEKDEIKNASEICSIENSAPSNIKLNNEIFLYIKDNKKLTNNIDSDKSSESESDDDNEIKSKIKVKKEIIIKLRTEILLKSNKIRMIEQKIIKLEKQLK